MSNGVEESARRSNNRDSEGGNRVRDDDDFAHVVARIALAQLCQATGFESAKLSALDALSELVVWYIVNLGKVAQFYANLSGRTACSVFDVVRSLEEMGAFRSVPNGSINYGVLSEINDYMTASVDVPFAWSLPRLPVACETEPRLSFASSGNVPQGKHIPDWLPPFPDVRTYVRTPVWDEKISDPKQEKIKQARQRRKAERSLLNLQRRLVSAGTSDSKMPIEANGEMGVAAKVGSFTEEKEVLISPPEEGNLMNKEYSVFDVFKPVVDAIANGTFDPGSNAVHPSDMSVFRYRLSRRTFDLPTYLGIQSSGRVSSWASAADEKDDKKRRALLIIGESVDDPQELHQL